MTERMRAGTRYLALINIEAILVGGSVLLANHEPNPESYVLTLSVPCVAWVLFIGFLNVFPSLLPAEPRARSLAISFPALFDAILLAAGCLFDFRPEAMIRDEPPIVYLHLWEKPSVLLAAFVLQVITLLSFGRLEHD